MDFYSLINIFQLLSCIDDIVQVQAILIFSSASIIAIGSYDWLFSVDT
jgi:hypothetical protein